MKSSSSGELSSDIIKKTAISSKKQKMRTFPFLLLSIVAADPVERPGQV
jgi:hypothetical protein